MNTQSSTDAASWSTHQINTTAGVMHWRETGHGDGPAIVFMHGILANGHLWDEVAARVAPHARCVLPEWPLGSHSHAMNADADLSVSGLVHLMHEFFELLGIKEFVLVGNDTGGALTQLFTVRYPQGVRGLVLTPCDAYDVWLPALFKPIEMAAFVPGALWLLSQLMRSRLVRRLPIAQGWLARRLTADISNHFALPWARSMGIRRDVGKILRDLGPRHTMAAAKSFAHIRVPVLVYWAREDRFFPARLAERLASDFPMAQLQWVDDAYTFVSIDQPERLALAINDYLHTHFSNDRHTT